MRFPLYSALLLIISLLMLSMIVSSESTDENDHTTIVLTGGGYAHSSEETTIGVRFYRGVVPVDADDVHISIGDPASPIRIIDVDEDGNRIGVGEYHVPIIFTLEDDHDSDGWIIGSIRCAREDGGADVSASSHFTIPLKDTALKVRVEVDDPHFTSDDDVTFDVRFTLNDTLIDPDDRESLLTVAGKSQEVSLTRIGIGQYSFVYETSVEAMGKDAILEVRGTLENSSGSDRAVSVGSNLQLWLNLAEQTENGFEGDISVLDLNGKGVHADLDIILRYRNKSFDSVVEVIHGSTTFDGYYELSVANLDVATEGENVEVTIWANVSGGRNDDVHQYGRSDIRIWVPGSPEPTGFDMVMKSDPISLVPETLYGLEYTAYFDGEPLADTEIHYYFHTASNHTGLFPGRHGRLGSVFKIGTTETDENGGVIIVLTTPDHGATISQFFRYNHSGSREGNGSWWECKPVDLEVMDPMLPDQSISIDVKNFVPGELATVNLSASGLNGKRGSMRILFVMPWVTAEWIEDYIISRDILGYNRIDTLSPADEGIVVGDTLTMELGIPDIFPEPVQFVMVGYVFETSDDGQEILRMNYIVLDRNGTPVDLSDRDFAISSDIPDSMEADSMVPMAINIFDEWGRPVEGAYVTLQTDGPIQTCQSYTTTDSSGVVHCLIQSDNFTIGTRNATIWINATKDDHNPGFYVKHMTIQSWQPLQNMTLHTNLPDVIDSGETRDMQIWVSSKKGPVEGVRVTIDALGSANTCKAAGTTDIDGWISCAVFAFEVHGENSSVTIFLNGTKDGYRDVFYVKHITIMGLEAPEEITDPIEKEIGGNVTVRVIASIVGNVTVKVMPVDPPDLNDSNAIGAYVMINATGTGSLRWVNITMVYITLPGGIDADKLRIFHWHQFHYRWAKAQRSGVDTEGRTIWANVTELGIIAPRELDDITPPVIEHKPMKRVGEGKNITIEAIITDDKVGVKVVTIFYRNEGDTIYKIFAMDKEGDRYTYTIQASEIRSEKIEYYIRASDGQNTATSPGVEGTLHTITIGEEKTDEGNKTAFIALTLVFVLLIIALLTFNMWSGLLDRGHGSDRIKGSDTGDAEADEPDEPDADSG